MIVRQKSPREHTSYSKVVGDIIAVGFVVLTLLMITCLIVNTILEFCSVNKVQVWQVQPDGGYRQVAWYNRGTDTHEEPDQEYPLARAKIVIYDDLTRLNSGG
jgi:hypothetical protein